MKENPDGEALTASLQHLQRSFKTLLLATEYQSQPALSYAPYSQDPQGRFYLLLSELAEHSRNLRANPRCSVMFIADESASRNLFARERLSYRCRADWVERSQPEYALQLEQLQQRFGSTVELLKGLNDFQLVRLTPESGRYVLGFGQAYDVDVKGQRIVAVSPP